MGLKGRPFSSRLNAIDSLRSVGSHVRDQLGECSFIPLYHSLVLSFYLLFRLLSLKESNHIWVL
jgi:hypothetical protein